MSPNLGKKMQISEAGLDALREEAIRTVTVRDRGIKLAAAPRVNRASAVSYHGHPVLKPPTWTWQIPLYFFVGGIAGTSAVIAFVARVSGSNPALIRVALWIAFIGALMSPPLLIAD